MAAAALLLLAALAAAAPSQKHPRPESSAQTHYNTTSAILGPARCACECGISNRQQRIVGGEPIKPHELPWMVAMFRKGKFYCAASVITPTHLLTAAHCVEGVTPDEIVVSVGEHDRNHRNKTITKEVKLANFIRHNNFTITTFNNDIALLKLRNPLNFSDIVRPACLPTHNNSNYTDQIALVAGWGRLDERKPTSNIPRKVAVPIMSMSDCKNAGYPPYRITNNMICAGYPEGKKDACQGDSGGPLHIEGKNGTYEIIGLVSWGRGCARPNFPGVYTRIDKYLDWLKENLKGECLCSPPKTSS